MKMFPAGKILLACALTFSSGLALAAEKYTGPRPTKADIPFLVHADNLLETEAGVARQEERKDATAYVVNGPASPARTPLAEPIFVVRVEKLAVDKLSAYRMEVKNGNREVAIPKKGKNAPKPVPLKVTRLDENLYRVEVDTPLENGQYTLTPDGSNDSFAFEIY